jgi:hypothetical protein
MSRKDELFKLARLFRSQARLTLDRPAKQALRKPGDNYQNEAKKLQGQPGLGVESVRALLDKTPTVGHKTMSAIGGKADIA